MSNQTTKQGRFPLAPYSYNETAGRIYGDQFGLTICDFGNADLTPDEIDTVGTLFTAAPDYYTAADLMYNHPIDSEEWERGYTMLMWTYEQLQKALAKATPSDTAERGEADYE